MRRCTILKGIDKETKLCHSTFGSETENLKHLSLQLSIVDTQTSTTDLDTIAHKVVGLGTYLLWLCLKQGNVGGVWHSEGMMGGHKALLLVAPFEEREIDNPEALKFVLIAKTETVAETFRADWNELTEKTYVARVEGEIAEDKGVFESYLQEDSDGYKVRSVPVPSKPPKPSKLSKLPKLARTEWRKLGIEDGTTLVEVSLKSGRKNQIRVHFSEAGHPVVGDVKYGAQKASRLYLHSARLRFKHPHTGAWLAFASRPSRASKPPKPPKPSKPLFS